MRPIPRAVDEQIDAGSPNLGQALEAPGPYLGQSTRQYSGMIRSEEIDEQVLVRERAREPIEADGAGDRLDDEVRLRRVGHVRRPRNSRRGSPIRSGDPSR